MPASFLLVLHLCQIVKYFEGQSKEFDCETVIKYFHTGKDVSRVLEILIWFSGQGLKRKKMSVELPYKWLQQLFNCEMKRVRIESMPMNTGEGMEMEET